jgi:hypothetical protein|tara:strand:+ start:300 stop:548 length:249 start_codon:yes stop_codon:yes gene_type:complete
MSQPSPLEKEIKIMYTDTSTRDYIITASSVDEAAEIGDLLYNTMEQSISDIVKQYNVNKKTVIWVSYTIDKDTTIVEEDEEL